VEEPPSPSPSPSCSFEEGIFRVLGAETVDCTVIRHENQPTGGGLFVTLLSKNTYDFGDGVSCQVLVDFLHNEGLNVELGDDLMCGELVGHGDSTGFSTGPHTHLQTRRV
jgi:murein DD-endopeptidase MepM/ murein hydrolase activator NlpD